MYLQAARSIAAFAGMCDRGLAEDMYEVAERDDTTINALTILHNHDYDCKRAIQALVKCPIPKGIDRKWSDDDQKKFIKGLRQYGKNFFRIRKDLLPHKQTSDLVEFYYLWKKTPQAQTTRSRRRQRPCSTSAILSTTPTPAKQRNTKNNNNNNNNNKDESEHNSDNDDNQITTDFDEQYCRHCQIASKNLQIAGHDNQLLCYSCRIYYEKSGQMPIINLECSPYLFKPLNRTSSTCTNSNKRKRSKPIQSPNDNNSLSTRSKKKTCLNEKVSLIKQKIEEEQESTIKKEIKLEEQENEKPSSFSTNSSLVIKTEDLNLRILTPTPCKQEFNSPSSMLSDNTTKILIDHTKQNNTNALITSPSSAFSRTSKQSLIPKISDESNSSLKSNTNHSTILNNNNVSTVISKDNDLSNDDENISDNSTNCIQEFICDQGPSPLICEKECYNRSQEIILLQVYDRSKSQNSCARTDIILKRRLPIRQKQTEKQQDLPSSTTTIINVKQEDRNLSKLSFSLDKGRSMHHQSGPPPHPLPTILPHHDSLLINRNNPLFHPLPLHGLASGSKPSLGFPSPFGPSPHENATLRHIDPLSLRLMNPAAAAAQYFAGQPPFPNGIGRPTHAGLDPATAAFLFDPHCRGMISPFANTSPSSIVLPPPPPPPPSLSSLNNSLSSSKINNGAPNHAHIHSHSRTHLHLANSNESSSNTTNGAPLPPSTLLPFANPFSGLSHGNPLLDTGGSLSVPINFEAIHNLTRERELMALILANNSRFDPMTLGLVNSLQMSRYDDFSRMNLRERTKREHNENVYRRLNLDNERQQLRFPFHHPPEELLRRF